MIKHRELLYVSKFALLTCLNWFKNNHLRYKCVVIDTTSIHRLLDNDIPNTIIKSSFKSTNVELANNTH
jgi:hypothetical protein